MAFLSAQVSTVKRRLGQNAVASAAYNARTKLELTVLDKARGITSTLIFDYSSKPGLAYSKIYAPDHAPEWVYDRQKLWNKCEQAENRCDANTAHKIMLPLPNELTIEQNIALLEDCVKELVKLGMIVDANIHYDNENNKHAHLMGSTRELVENRYGEIEFAATKNRAWNHKNFVNFVRQMHADKVNEHYVMHGYNKRFCPKSYKDLGIDLIPGVHEGPARSINNAELSELNRRIAAENAEKIKATLTKSDAKEMYYLLQGTDAAKYFTKDNAKTAASIVSVLMANIKSLKFLKDGNESNSFAIEHYLNSINEGGKNWLFLSTDPSARELTLPLNAALLEILISRMRRTRTTPENRIWIVIDELPSLGKLPGLSQLMQEGRKYGSCVLAGIQSTSQLYHHYGDADASSLIGLFKTKFAFSSDDPRMGELYSKLCGTKITISQQKNTSFGANEFRDGISYNEKQDKLPLVSYEEFSKLSVGECYAILPEKSVRVAKIQTPKAEVPNKNFWFMETSGSEQSVDEKLGSDDLPPAGETKSTSKQKELSKGQVESNNDLLQPESNKNKEPIRDIDISFD